MRVVIFSGTTEGRQLSAQTVAMGIETVVCVATEYGRSIQQQVPGTHVLTGRMDASQMAEVLARADLCIDATHPYAKEVSKNIRAAAELAHVPCHRLLRRESPLPSGCVTVDSAKEAAGLLKDTQGNILLTTGAKELAAFEDIERGRLYPRVLPVRESIAACEDLQIPRENIIAMQGPFGYELNCALLHQFSIKWLVTKDGGAAGGFDEKVRAAADCNAGLVVIRRPKETGESFEEIVKICMEMMECR